MEAPSKPKSPYGGKTYNSADAIAEFFKKKNMAVPERQNESGNDEPERTIEYDEPPNARPTSGYDRLKSYASEKPKQEPVSTSWIVAGSHVRHAKYGKGLVLRREGSGDNVKLTISFPGFGQKKMIEKFANLQKA